MRILVTGARGMLGTDLVCILEEKGHEIFATDVEELDITLEITTRASPGKGHVSIVYKPTSCGVLEINSGAHAVDSVTGKNSGDNTGVMAPYFHYEEWDEPTIKVELMLKGGGCENVSDQYKLPDSRLKADRNLDGVYKCIIDAINKAQGLGCAPGVAGIGIGGDRASGMIVAKKQLFRKLNDTNPDPELEKLENRLYTDLNKLGIGPMGFGGLTTMLGVKIGAAHRLPASFFVSLAYSCWADRRNTMLYTESEVSYD